MREKEFKKYMSQTTWYKKSHSPKEVLDRVVSHVKEFENYLKGHKRTLEKANPCDIEDFIKRERKKSVSRDNVYVNNVMEYYRYLKKPAMVRAAEDIKRRMKEWNWTEYVKKRDQEGLVG